MHVVEMCHGRAYHYKGMKYERFTQDGEPIQYEVDSKLAYELIHLATPRGMPYFRLSVPVPKPEAEPEEDESASGAERTEALPDLDDLPDLGDEDGPPPKVTKRVVKKKAGQRPPRRTASKEGDDGESEEV